MSRILSAVAWPYANGPRHIGHVAGFGVPSDVFSRYMRMAGHDVLMVSGTDEHGTPILVAADSAGMSARELADQNNRLIVEDLVQLGLSYDLFTRTTAGNHYRVVQDMFRTVRDNGYMIEQVTRAAISPSTGRTLPDRYIEGTCPICGAESVGLAAGVVVSVAGCSSFFSREAFAFLGSERSLSCLPVLAVVSVRG